MQRETLLYVALAALVVAFVWAWRVARERRRRTRLLKRAVRGVSSSRTTSLPAKETSQRSSMRWAESKSEVLEQLSRPRTQSPDTRPTTRSKRRVS